MIRGEKCTKACLEALETGYRHIDSAQLYQNESRVREALRDSDLDRSEIFITTKIRTSRGSVEADYQSVRESVRKIAGKDGYVDSFLVHTPQWGAEVRKDMWLALEKLLSEGWTKSIGVSNYGIEHIKEMKEYATTWPPHVNQIEVSESILQETSIELRFRVANALHSSILGANKRIWSRIARTLVSWSKLTVLLSEAGK